MPRPRKSSPPKPTTGELEILAVLWEHGSLSVRAVYNHLAAASSKSTGYSTTLKMMQLMREKGLLDRDDSVRPQIYSAALTRQSAEVGLLDELSQKVFGGSAANLVMSLVSSRKVKPEDLDEMERLIKEAKRQRNNPNAKG